ncbi:MAG: sulfite exporter TauE/SafE family protein [Candidatus Cybelea sp.]
MRFALELFGAAFLASVFGSMVGLGGGFILVPILRLFLGFSPAYAAGTSLVLIVANSASGALTYLLQRRVHLKIGLLIAAGGLPGSILGAIASFHISARLFDTILAVLLLAVAVDMAWNAQRRMAGRPEHERVTSIKGMSYRAALGLGFIVGIFSSLFGLGGGIVLVPSFLYFSELPAHSISATSHFAILLTSPVGLVVHILQRDIVGRDILPLVAGGLLGGPIGARLSLRLKSPQLLIVVAIALVTAAVSLIWRQL